MKNAKLEHSVFHNKGVFLQPGTLQEKAVNSWPCKDWVVKLSLSWFSGGPGGEGKNIVITAFFRRPLMLPGQLLLALLEAALSLFPGDSALVPPRLPHSCIFNRNDHVTEPHHCQRRNFAGGGRPLNPSRLFPGYSEDPRHVGRWHELRSLRT